MIRKSILIFIALSFFSVCFAGSIQDMHKAAIARKNAASSSIDYSQDASCEGAYRMNVTNATEPDISVNSIDLAQNGGDMPTNADDPYTEASGVSRDFYVDQCLNVNDAGSGDLDISGDPALFSIVAWFKNDTIVNAQVQTIVAKWDEGGTADKQYHVAIKGSATDEFAIRGRVSANGTDDVTVVSTATNYLDDTWYHVAIVGNDTDLRIYINGTLDSSATTAHTTGIVDGDADFQIGGQGLPTGIAYAFDGLIDEVGVFSRALSATEVSNIYTDGLFGDNGSGD